MCKPGVACNVPTLKNHQVLYLQNQKLKIINLLLKIQVEVAFLFFRFCFADIMHDDCVNIQLLVTIM